MPKVYGPLSTGSPGKVYSNVVIGIGVEFCRYKVLPLFPTYTFQCVAASSETTATSSEAGDWAPFGGINEPMLTCMTCPVAYGSRVIVVDGFDSLLFGCAALT
jgi:hypothetical protein